MIREYPSRVQIIPGLGIEVKTFEPALTVVEGGGGGDALLLEDGSYLLLEDGSKLLLE